MTPKEVTPKEGTPKRKRGGQPGNCNAMKAGRRSRQLNLSGMPPSCLNIQRSVYRLRDALEQAVEQARGEISVVDACHIQSAARHEAVAQLAANYLRLTAESGEMIDAKIRLSYLQAIANHSAARDKCVKELRLGSDATAIDDLAAYYAAESTPVEHDDNTDAKEGDDEADPGTT